MGDSPVGRTMKEISMADRHPLELSLNARKGLHFFSISARSRVQRMRLLVYSPTLLGRSRSADRACQRAVTQKEGRQIRVIEKAIHREAARRALKASGAAGDRQESNKVTSFRNVLRQCAPGIRAIDDVAVRGHQLENPTAQPGSQVYRRCLSVGAWTDLPRSPR